MKLKATRKVRDIPRSDVFSRAFLTLSCSEERVRGWLYTVIP